MKSFYSSKRYDVDKIMFSEIDCHRELDKIVHHVKNIARSSPRVFVLEEVEDDIKELMKIKIRVSKIVSKYA